MKLTDRMSFALPFLESLILGCASEAPAEDEGVGSGSTIEAEITTSTVPSMSSSSSSADTSASTEGSSSDDTEAPGVECLDRLILDLSLVEGLVSEGIVTNEAEGDGWRSFIDASAGGLPNAAMNPWVYLRFTTDGLQRVEIDDFAAVESSEWHIAAKRFGIRLNSGTSGPGNVAAAPIDGESYDEIHDLPNGALPLEEDFYDDDCMLLDDGSGLGSPAYVLTPWWTYPGCVATTGTPFVLELPEGRVKLVVEAYYASGQATCNESGAMGSAAASFTWRWAELP